MNLILPANLVSFYLSFATLLFYHEQGHFDGHNKFSELNRYFYYLKNFNKSSLAFTKSLSFSYKTQLMALHGLISNINSYSSIYKHKDYLILLCHSRQSKICQDIIIAYQLCPRKGCFTNAILHINPNTSFFHQIMDSIYVLMYNCIYQGCQAISM